MRARALLVLALVPGVSASSLAQQVPLSETGTALVQKLTGPDAVPLVSYRAIRRITASTQGGRMVGSMEVLTMLEGNRFTWEVRSEQGSSLIRSRVLKAALEAEADSQAPDVRAQAALNERNYEFLAMNALSPTVARLDLRPRRKHVMLVNGSLLMNSESGDLLSVDGELSKRPSFWTRRVHVTREYGRVGGVHVPISMKSTADVLIAGRSTFEMSYQYLEVNGQPVVH